MLTEFHARFNGQKRILTWDPLSTHVTCHRPRTCAAEDGKDAQVAIQRTTNPIESMFAIVRLRASRSVPASAQGLRFRRA